MILPVVLGASVSTTLPGPIHGLRVLRCGPGATLKWGAGQTRTIVPGAYLVADPERSAELVADASGLVAEYATDQRDDFGPLGPERSPYIAADGSGTERKLFTDTSGKLIVAALGTDGIHHELHVDPAGALLKPAPVLLGTGDIGATGIPPPPLTGITDVSAYSNVRLEMVVTFTGGVSVNIQPWLKAFTADGLLLVKWTGVVVTVSGTAAAMFIGPEVVSATQGTSVFRQDRPMMVQAGLDETGDPDTLSGLWNLWGFY